ncbi:unnamed protein product [Peronospora belbahrii]|uniref:Uncharacterized protein n=1 Tax=Peronospora belbahrii TaxID=622444 RepID=A0AAU9L5D3_9STRA|nr:unnamed protein product [Peronospora belbahrii]CAH0519189.1 unnamed protein product [Peronospora belbahrii]
MRISGIIRVALLATAAISALALPSMTEANTLANMAAFDNTRIDLTHETRVLAADPAADGDAETAPPKKKHKKKAPAPADDTYEASAPEATPEATKPPRRKKAAKAAEKKTTNVEETTEAPKKKKKKAPLFEDADSLDVAGTPNKAEKSEETEERLEEAPKKKKVKKAAKKDETTKTVNEKKIKGDSNDGIIDGSSEGSAEIDKINLDNEDGWVSVYDDPPLLVIKASLYAFISYNDSEVCDTFNMTMNAVEQKPEESGRFAYHVVAYINCTKNGEDETQGRFILNFIPEGKRLLLTECGHREEGEIVNWLRIEDEVPECMTPKQRKQFLAQPMKHIHASNGLNPGAEAVQTDFMTRLEELDAEEVAIVGSATIALFVIIAVLVLFIIRKRKIQKDLERTIAGAKAEHAVEDDDLQTEVEEKATKERKGLMDSAKAKSDDPDMEEGSFVNSPAVRV